MIKSKIKISELILLLIGIIITSLLGVIFLFYINYQRFHLVIGLINLSLSFLCFYHFFNYPVLIITQKELIIKTITGKAKRKILLSTIKSYTEIKKENGEQGLAHRKWQDLTLIGDDFTYKISSSAYRNYPEIRNSLVKGLKKNKQEERRWYDRNLTQWGIGLIIFVFLFLLIL